MKKTEIEDAAFHDRMMTRPELRDSLVKELKSVLIFLSEVVHSTEATEALVDVYWKRYEAMKAKKAAEPELPLKERANVH